MTTDFRLDHALNGLSDKEKKDFLEYIKLEDAIIDYVDTNELDNAEGIKVLFFNQSDMKTVTEEKKFKLV